MPDTLLETADSLDAMRDAVVEAASFTASLWMSYLLVFFYLLIAIASVTQRDLFLENPVQLPFLDVSVPLQGFFFAGPGVFVIIHTYVLLHFSMLASKIGIFNEKLRGVTKEPLRTVIRQALPNNVFVHFLAGPQELRRGFFGFLLRSISWVSLVLGPIFLLMFFQLQFLCFHDELITNLQRCFAVADFIVLWTLWPDASHGAIAGTRLDPTVSNKGLRIKAKALFNKAREKPTTYAFMTALTAASAFIVFMVATFPGDRLHFDSNWQPIKWARSELVNGTLNPASGKLSSYWTDSLVLPNFDPIDHSKFEGEVQFDDVSSTYSVRGRNLSYAIFTNDDFQKFDFTGSDLSHAKFNDADLKEAKLTCTINESNLLNTFYGGFQIQSPVTTGKSGIKPGGNGYSGLMNLKPANTAGRQIHDGSNPLDVPQKCTTLKKAFLIKAQLQGADFRGADLDDALLEYAQAQAALFDGTNLRGAKLDYAALQDASFTSAHLENATLKYALLNGALLDGAFLNGAGLEHAELQGASFQYANLQNAKLGGADLKDVSFRYTTLRGDDLDDDDLENSTVAKLDLTHVSLVFANFAGASFENVTPITMQSMLQHRYTVDPEQYQTQIMQMWEQIGCEQVGAPYIIRSIIPRMSRMFGSDVSDQSKLVVVFEKPSCAGNQGLNDSESAQLRALGASNKTN